jgi:hypothetical protein
MKKKPRYGKRIHMVCVMGHVLQDFNAGHYGANLWLVKRVANDLAQSPRNSVRMVEEDPK